MKMKYCISCGKKIGKKTKYCLHCGQNIESKEINNKEAIQNPQKNIALIIPISFIVLVGAVVFFLSQSSNDSDVDISNILPRELTENVVDIINPADSGKISQPTTKREGYSLDEKPFDDRNYAYDERTKDFRLVCINPCPVPKSILDQEFAAISHAVSTTRGLTQSDIDESLMPFEVHASKDDVCPRVPGALAYMNSFTDNNGYNRGKLCFFFDELYYNRDKFPYSTSIHEVMHLFEENKLPPYTTSGSRALWEGLSEMLESFFLKGNERNSFCWNGNKWWLNALGVNPHDPHDVGRDLFFELCNQYGFDYDDLPELFRELERRNVDGREFVDIINNIVGADTSYLFRNAGVI